MDQKREIYRSVQPMDYGQMRSVALEHIGRISSKYWTDHGIHDPGITILEQLCFALVDLGYRTSFDIRDLLTPEGSSQPRTKDSFILAEEILPCAPVTVGDYRRLILQNMRGMIHDVHIDTERKRFTFVPGGLKEKEMLEHELSVGGYYRVLIEPEGNPEGVDIRRIKELLRANRNICEEFIEPVLLEPLPIGIIAEIELERDADYREVTREIWDGVRKYISPDIPYRSLDELLSMGKSLDEILEGPLPPFDGNFVMEDDLAVASRRTELHISDVKSIILGTDGVVSIKHLSFSTSPGTSDFVSITGDTLTLVKSVVGTRYLTLQGLSFDGTDISRVVYEINGFPFELGKHVRCEPVMFDAHEILYGNGVPVHIPIPEGRHRNITSYHSPQNELPEAYHTGSAGIYPDENPDILTKRLQLKAYISFFDQILSDYLEQLSSVGNLLSWKDCGSTYFHHRLTDDEVLDISKVMDEYEGYGRKLDAKRAAQRRNAILNHLLARFNETFVDYSMLRYLQVGSEAYDFSLEERVKDMEAFLSDYTVTSAERAQGNPIQSFENQDGWIYGEAERRISRRLGIDNPPPRLAPAIKKGSKEDNPSFDDNSNGDYNSVFGLHLIEHSLLVPDGSRIEAGLFLRLSTDEYGESIAEDPYSFQVTAVLPGWLKISGNSFFRSHVERIIREEMPAHISVKVCWVSEACMYGIERYYTGILSALAENDGTRRNVMLEKFIAVFGTVRNIYPISKIFSYDGTLIEADQDEITRLNASAIGESPAEYPDSLQILPENPTVCEACTLKLNVRALPEGVSASNLSWISSRSQVATVDNDGNVKGLLAGKSLITVTDAGGAKASCILSVTEMSLKDVGETIENDYFKDLAGEVGIMPEEVVEIESGATDKPLVETQQELEMKKILIGEVLQSLLDHIK